MAGHEHAVTRRKLLAGLGSAAAVGAAGCVDGLFAITDSGPEPISVTVKAPPADDDAAASAIGRTLSEYLDLLGADVTYGVRADQELTDDLLVEHDFDVFVMQLPQIEDPDRLRPLCHSAYTDEAGWQNPFGVTDDRLDELLEAQATAPGAERAEYVQTLQQRLFEVHPFSVVAIPDELTAIGDHLPGQYRPDAMTDPMDVLRLGDRSDSTIDHLHIGILDERITVERNPLTPPYSSQRLVLGLIYDPLIRPINGGAVRWMASELRWQPNDQLTVEVDLREGLTWHDGGAVTADDVAFTYELLRDVTGGEADEPIPATRFREATSLIDDVQVTGDLTLEFTFTSASQDVARRALMVPILPESDWAPRQRLDEDGNPVATNVANEEPNGSGPYAFDATEPSELLRLQREESHFLYRNQPDDALADLVPGHPVETVELTVPTHPPVTGAAINQIESAELDIIKSVPADEAAAVTRSEAATLSVSPTDTCYVVGFNCRRGPTADRSFRRFLGQLLNRTFIVASVFRGFAHPAETPLATTRFQAPSLAWDGESELGAFPGSSNFLDLDQARSLAREAGYAFEGDAFVAP